MWFPWFQKLLRESHRTQEILQQHVASIRDASQAREEKHAEIGASIAAAIKTAGDAVPEYEKCQRKKEHSLQWGIFWVTLAGVIFAALAAGGAWYYAHIARKQLDKMDDTYKEMRRQTYSAAQSAYATCEAAKIAQQSLRQYERQANEAHNASIGSESQVKATIRDEAAVMYVNRASPSQLSTGSPVTIPVEIKNAGKSEATGVHVEAVVKILKVGMEPDFTYPRLGPKGSNWDDVGLVFPIDPPLKFDFGAFDDSGEQILLNQATYDELHRGEYYISLYGKVTYLDIFGQHHWVHFCSYFGHIRHYDQFPRCTAYSRMDRVALEGPSTITSTERGEDISCPAPPKPPQD